MAKLIWILFPLLSVFSNAAPTALVIREGHLTVTFPSAPLAASHEQIMECVTRAATAVSQYYGKFPVKKLQISVIENKQPDRLFGQEFGGNLVKYFVGKAVSFQTLKDDWMLTHEMFHTGFPNFDGYEWADEGLATYLEPIARVRAGFLPVESVWSQLVWGLPKGLPQKGDLGLSITHTWGRTYWGGALFWFLTDLSIREKTNNVKSLDTAIRAIWKKGGDGSADWEIEEMVKIGDEAVGFPALRQIYDRLALKPGTEDLEVLWKRLGVSVNGDKVTFDDKAPLAYVRKAITDSAMQITPGPDVKAKLTGK